MKILTAKELSAILRKSERWVYLHAIELGGAYLGGSWFFSESEVENAIQRGKDVARRRKNQRQEDSPKVGFLTEKRRCRMGAQRKREREEAARRHGLDDLLH